VGFCSRNKTKYFWMTLLSVLGVGFLLNKNHICLAQNDEGEEVAVCESGIIINEIYPFTTEFVELKNIGEEKCDLSGWSITDELGFDPEDVTLKEKSWSYHRIFAAENTLIDSGGYFAFEGNLNLNDPDDSVKLFNSQKEKVDQLIYGNSVKGKSYSFFGEKWDWVNPSLGLENSQPQVEEELASSLQIAIKIDKDIYRDIYADFEVTANEKDFGVTWDFGDGHKSYKAETTHKYEKIGEYEVSVKVSGQDETVSKQMEIEVEKFPDLKVRIVAVNPNPIGDDSEETIVIKNKSKKKINLKGWSLATGTSEEELTNHPIHEDLKIRAGKEATIDRNDSAFSLGNQKSYIELRYPDGRVCDDVEYESEKTVAEGAIYRKDKNGQWIWDLSGLDETSALKENDFGDGEVETIFGFAQEEDALETISLLLDEFEREWVGIYGENDLVQNPADEVAAALKSDAEIEIGQISPVELENMLEKIWKDSADNFSAPKKLSKISLDKNGMKIENNQIKFTHSIKSDPHWVVSFWQSFSNQANAKINSMLNKREYESWE